MEKGHTIKVLDKGYVRLVDWMGTDSRIVEAARVSYADYDGKGNLVAKDRTPEDDKKLLGYLYKNRHTSPFEMCKITLDFKMPIFVARQYIRHRMQNLNEFSMRYKEAPDEFYIPGRWRAQDTKNKQGSVIMEGWDGKADEPNPNRHEVFNWELEDHCKNAFQLYQRYLKEGVAREMARMVLPLNIYTYFYATWDLKNMLHFIALRDDAHAQAEIQDYGKAIKTILRELFPWTMEAYERYHWRCIDTQAEIGQINKDLAKAS